MGANLGLMIDDDVKLTQLLSDYLSQFGYSLVTAADPDEGLELLRKRKPQFVILDIMLPKRNGFEVIKEIRRDSRIPVIMLTARGDLNDRIVGLELGADDYLPKPFEPRELVARIQTVLRRVHEPLPRKVIVSGDLTVDFGNRSATLAGAALDLTTMDFEILALFLTHPGEPLSRDEIMERTRGIDWEAYNRSIDVSVSRLRQKLKDDPKSPLYFKTIWGTGYMFIGKVETHVK